MKPLDGQALALCLLSALLGGAAAALALASFAGFCKW
jgi:hypothetical protein